MNVMIINSIQLSLTAKKNVYHLKTFALAFSERGTRISKQTSFKFFYIFKNSKKFAQIFIKILGQQNLNKKEGIKIEIEKQDDIEEEFDDEEELGNDD